VAGKALQPEDGAIQTVNTGMPSLPDPHCEEVTLAPQKIGVAFKFSLDL